MEQLESYKTFVHLVKTGSFTKTAEQLHMSQPNVTRIINLLEKDLDTTLLKRSTRSLQLTDNGTAFYKHCNSILEQVGDFHNYLSQKKGDVCGTIHMAAPLYLGNSFYPVFSNFSKEYPNIKVKMIATNTAINHFEQGLDLSLQVGSLDDNSKENRIPMGNRQMVFVSTKTYLNGHSTPTQPSDLKTHNCIVFTQTNDYSWLFQNQGKEETMYVNASLSSSSMVFVIEALRKGLGIACLPYFFIKDELKSGEFVEVLSIYRPKPSDIYISHNYGAFLPSKVSVLIDYLKEHSSNKAFDLMDRSILV